MKTRLCWKGLSESMKLLKKINNNFALALDSRGEQIIVEGKGIGFQKMPSILTDLSRITRTYYGITEQDISLIRSVSNEVLDISGRVYEYAQQRIADRLNPNLTFILADHIEFSIERYEKKIDIKMPFYYDIKFLYPKETEIAEYALRLIRNEMKIPLPDSELTGIAMNIINSELVAGEIRESKTELVESVTKYIEKKFSLKISRDSFSYSRFVSHMEYLLRRAQKNQEVSVDNQELYNAVRKEIPEIGSCVDGIEILLKRNGLYLNEEEKLYLMLHVNRLCDREGL